MGPIAEGSEEETREEDKFVNWDTQLSAHAMVAMIDNIGLTVCLIIPREKIAHRNLVIRGKIIVEVGKPLYRAEVPVTHALRAMRDWIQENRSGLYNITNAVIHAGDPQTNYEI